MAHVGVRGGEELLGYLPSRVALLEGDQVRVGFRGACRLPVEADDGRFHLRRPDIRGIHRLGLPTHHGAATMTVEGRQRTYLKSQDAGTHLSTLSLG